MLWMMSLVLLVCDAGAGIILTEGSDGIVHGVVTMMSRRNLNGKMLSFPMELWRMQREQQRGGDPWKQRVHAIAPSPELLSYCDKEGWGYRFTCVEVRECWACSVWPPASCVYVARPLRLLERAQVQHLTQQAVSELQRCLVADVCNHYAFKHRHDREGRRHERLSAELQPERIVHGRRPTGQWCTTCVNPRRAANY
jgi:hypothetical protein